MIDTKQCCGNCHWFKAHDSDIFGSCQSPIPDSAEYVFRVIGDEGEACPTFRQRGERLPQRFRYRFVSDGEWFYGVCMYVGGMWRIRTENGRCGSVVDGEDPTRRIVQMFIEPPWLEWIDRDYGWKDSP